MATTDVMLAAITGLPVLAFLVFLVHLFFFDQGGD